MTKGANILIDLPCCRPRFSGHFSSDSTAYGRSLVRRMRTSRDRSFVGTDPIPGTFALAVTRSVKKATLSGTTPLKAATSLKNNAPLSC